MSIRLTSAIWDSALTHHEKPLMAVLADFANDEGEHVYPSQAYLAWKLGVTDRAVRYALSNLERKGIIEPVWADGGGRAPVNYRINVDAIPTRPPWRPRKPTSAHPGSPLPPPRRKPTSADPYNHQKNHQRSGRIESLAEAPPLHSAEPEGLPWDA